MAELAVTAVALPAVFDLDALDGVRDALLDAIDTRPVRLRANGVERVSTNALLMLLAAARSARGNGQALIISAPSPQMRGAIDRLGLSPAFAELIQG